MTAVNKPVVIISGVDSMGTGVDNVKIETLADTTAIKNAARTGSTAKAYPGYIYTLFDNDGYVIAAVIVGEAKGTSANYAYILTAAESEEIIDDTYYWTFKAVVDGAEQKLTVKSKFANTINSLLPGHVQELRYNGDYVTGVKTPAKTTPVLGL